MKNNIMGPSRRRIIGELAAQAVASVVLPKESGSMVLQVTA